MLSKEQVANLSTEQQEALANVELFRTKRRQILLNEVRGLHKPWLTGWKIAASWLLVYAAVYFGLEAIKSSSTNISMGFLGVIIVNFVAMSYTAGINRKLNALITFLEEEGKLDPVPKRTAEDVK